MTNDSGTGAGNPTEAQQGRSRPPLFALLLLIAVVVNLVAAGIFLLNASSVEARVKQLSENRAELASQAGAERARLTEATTAVATLQAEKDALQAEVETVKGELSQLTTRRETVGSAIGEALAATSELEKLEEQLDSTRTRIQQAEEELGSVVDAGNAARANTAEKEKNEQNAELSLREKNREAATLEARITDLKTQITSLSTELQALGAKKQELEAVRGSLTAAEQQKAAVAALRGDIQSLTSQRDSLQTEIARLQSDREAGLTSVYEAQEQLTTSLSRRAQLGQESTGLQAEIREMETEKKTLQSGLDLLNQKVRDAKVELRTLQTEIELTRTAAAGEPEDEGGTP